MLLYEYARMPRQLTNDGANSRSSEPATGRRAPQGGLARRNRPVDALLACGVFSTALYVAMDVAAALRYEGYSYKSQTISELSAVGAPTRRMWLWLVPLYELLVFAFGLGVWLASGTRRSLRRVAALVFAFGAVGVAWPFAPMHRREVLAAGGGTVSDTMHLVLAGVTVALTVTTIGLGAATFGKRFHAWSIATIGVLLVFGSLVGIQSPRVGKDEPTPWIGIWERINVFGSMLWFSALAMVLLREQHRTRCMTVEHAGQWASQRPYRPRKPSTAATNASSSSSIG
jgi:hypothetical protein